ncbi:translation initiation factor [Pseudidiomarina terrestris]|uniref:Stress response translation initiation inhibitor YciH n=1 Tax=Pseudidiomarina terrestris TaxID=2820060 RepID=A0AAW7QXU5_9GAMM|nr:MULTISPECIES: stress response translation initiation inhibitor YciH [unclassified Pseudidiomarina]MDN7123893.1 stress response translation initiation inhibitor YciH [Pseudidiomarina sp. 1APP75-32.1]MDN7127647.1 stress response translation initiation inhibitor YciH [Pseudidiomarina sp. 1APR75-33.1]MDN7130393.1 stress response translation initiation inhibitor YciH [Pseudidiomarina sp. 1APR75-15]MDN7136316.1 stress response translation initiation inhibitor YciH [Pseudidiomarina sp. 1ASP75-5]MD
MSSLSEQLKNLGFEASAEAPQEQSNTAASIDTSIPVRIQRQTKGRKGKGVTVIMDLPTDPQLLSDYAKQLRKQCGVGGSVKNETIELQGDQREASKAFLEQQGFKVKLAGG